MYHHYEFSAIEPFLLSYYESLKRAQKKAAELAANQLG
ncbi:hypothetical protein RR47_GL000595 [Enterococcus columbae DSM 7374 = ATCC 51263]|nr:hypothetical protein RR47_GL000595 [Enterococcus columbae DSM 7374 = ATCC 51263]